MKLLLRKNFILLNIVTLLNFVNNSITNLVYKQAKKNSCKLNLHVFFTISCKFDSEIRAKA